MRKPKLTIPARSIKTLSLFPATNSQPALKLFLECAHLVEESEPSGYYQDISKALVFSEPGLFVF
ncbi:hypothetical protein [Pseudodesulfovibrio nedwellii]|nr:hypothetical protein [Pseudodesulfovibrio nedwellii]